MSETKENKMGTMPIKRLIITLSLPMMVSMLVQALYNIVDSIFVSKVGESALTAVTLAYPFQSLMISVAAGLGVGVNALLSRSLGEKNFDQADKAACKGLMLTFFSFLAFLFIGLFASGPFIRSQTSNSEIISQSCSYLRIVCCMSLGMFFQFTNERLLQSTGRTLLAMCSQLTGAVINIIFDPIMIFGLYGFPKMGVSGAALATVLGQSTAALISLVLNLKFNKDIHLSIKGIFEPAGDTVKSIFLVGVPTILMMSIGSLMTYLMNKILIAFSETAAAVFGVYFKLQNFFFMPLFGMNNGLIPVLAYNYGAKKKDRIDEALRFSITLAICIMVIGTILFELFPHQLLRLFNASENMMQLGTRAMHVIALHFPFAAVGVSLGSVFQAFSKSIYSLIISLSRQLFVLIPSAWLLGKITGDVNQVWWCFLIAEIVSCALSVIFFKKVYREVIEPLKAEHAA